MCVQGGGGGGGKSEGMARLVSVGNRLELDLEPLLMSNGGGGQRWDCASHALQYSIMLKGTSGMSTFRSIVSF